MLILGQIMLGKGQLCPAALGKGLGQGTAGLEPTAGAKNKKNKPTKLVFNIPRSYILPLTAPDPIAFLYLLFVFCIIFYI